MKTENSQHDTDDAIIEIMGMHKWYGPFHVLKDINLTVRKGERIVICGPSGSGKSTMIRCINRLEEHQKGQILVEGTELTSDLKNIERIRREVGMVFQHFNLFPHLSVVDNLTLAPIWVRKMPKKEAIDKAMYYLERVKIPEQAKKYPGQLSGGQQQRVAIARAVIARPQLLIADEPTGNVDPEMALKLLRLFEALNNRVGTTIVVATHDVQLIQKVPESLIMRLNKGRLSDPTGALRYPPARSKAASRRVSSDNPFASETGA